MVCLYHREQTALGSLLHLPGRTVLTNSTMNGTLRYKKLGPKKLAHDFRRLSGNRTRVRVVVHQLLKPIDQASARINRRAAEYCEYESCTMRTLTRDGQPRLRAAESVRASERAAYVPKRAKNGHSSRAGGVSMGPSALDRKNGAIRSFTPSRYSTRSLCSVPWRWQWPPRRGRRPI